MWKKLRALIKILIMVSIISTLSNNGRAHAQPTGLTLKEGKFGVNRELNYNLRGWDAMLESVEILNDKLMALHFYITNNTGKDQSTWVPKDYKSTIYVADNFGIKYPIIDFQGITKEPEKTRVPRGKTIRYSLMFPVFREGAKSFSFTEGGYVFKNIEIVYGQEAITLPKFGPAEQKEVKPNEPKQLEKIVFTLTDCSFYLGMVTGAVPQEIDLSNDTTAKEILEQALKFAKEKCRASDYRLCLFKSGEKCDPWGRGGSVWAEYDNKKLTWSKYENHALRKRLEEEAVAAGVIRPLPGNKFLFYLGIDSETGVKFWNITSSRSNKCDADLTSGNAYLYGEVPNTVSLLDDKIVRPLFIAGSKTFLDNCKEFVERRREANARIYVTLIPVDYKAQYQDGKVEFNPRLAWARIFFQGKNESLNIEEIVNFVSIAQQDERSKAEFLKWFKDTGSKFAILSDEKAIEQFISGVRDQAFLRIYTSVNYYRDCVDDIKARNPQILWDKMLTDFYLNHDRGFREFMTSGKEGWGEWMAQSLTAHGMTGHFIIKSFRPFITKEMQWRILEKKDGVLFGSNDPVKIVYVKLNYPDPKNSPIVNNTVIKETIFEFGILKKSGLIASIKHLVQGDIAWPKTP